MRSVGSTISLTTHVAIVAAVVLGTANARPKEPERPEEVTLVLGPILGRHERGVRAPLPNDPETVVVPWIPAPTIPLQAGTTTESPMPLSTQNVEGISRDRDVRISQLFSSEGPEALSGPLPSYPELLRQAGIQGRVVLEATVDTTGRVEPVSVTIISATNPAFVEPARQALLATLFRPAEVGGRATRMRVRIPFEFTLKSGTAAVR